jgi:penicillin V acylase-like amidase (Ntn superfamily)
MKIFVIYDSEGFVWERAYTSSQSAINVVSLYIEQENVRGPMKMPTEFTYKYAEGGVLVAHTLDYKFCIFFKELTL